MIDAAVVGGGIAGLATAYELSRRNRSFVVLERGQRPGGVVFSEEINGFTIDGGPDALLIQKPDGIELCKELGLGERLVVTKPPRLAYIQRGGRLHALPAQDVHARRDHGHRRSFTHTRAWAAPGGFASPHV